MTSLLYVTSSLNDTTSQSRAVADELIARLRRHHPALQITPRALTPDTMPHLSAEMLTALGRPAGERTLDQQRRVSFADDLIAEVEAADVLVITAPMYNFAIPSTLKAWIDHIARAGRTFRYTADGPEGLLKNKRVYIVTARGGVHQNGPMDFQEPYLRGVLGFLGLTSITFVHAEGLAMGPDAAAAGLAAARATIDTIAPERAAA